MTVYIGIDPGVTGAFAYDQEGIVHVCKTPVVGVGKAGREYNRYQMSTAIDRLRVGKDVQAVIEKQQFRPTDGKGPVFKVGYGFGVWMGILAEVAVEVVSPQKWKKFFGLSKDKGESIVKAQELFPEQDVGRNHNLAEALLLMEYGRRVFA